MRFIKQKRIPSEYRGKPDPEKLIREHHKAFMTFAVGGLMPPWNQTK
jgi:hypothetical protein